ncbi:hypothetical protein NQ318_008660 [Aromia moschata]|uniref:Uncharacterized protein n=1 Tax=Aromia moschata TaxID=1265417 RepID=A0AAV8XKC5_9CUCU|nr:hypothetical protein NQ318_008660 [Aromia moschata]
MGGNRSAWTQEDGVLGKVDIRQQLDSAYQAYAMLKEVYGNSCLSRFLNGLNGLKRDVKRSKTIRAPDSPQRQKLTKTLKQLTFVHVFGISSHCATVRLFTSHTPYVGWADRTAIQRHAELQSFRPIIWQTLALLSRFEVFMASASELR